MSDNENSACWVAFFTVPMPVPLSCRSSLTLNAFRSVFVGFIRSGPTPPNPLPRPPGLPPDPFQFSREVCGSAVSELIVCEFREDHFPTSPQRRVSVHNSYLPLHRGSIVSPAVQAAHSCRTLLGLNPSPEFVNLYFPLGLMQAGVFCVFLLVAAAF